MATPQGKLSQRQAIVNEALSWVGNSHYLWGTAGHTPNNADGAKYKPFVVAKLKADSLNQQKPFIKTAYTVVGNQTFTCAGCSRIYSQPAIEETKSYLNGGESPRPEWLSPRVYVFGDKPQSIGRANNGIVWGETCDDIKHFDCIGFVNYCISLFTPKHPKFGTSIIEYMTRPANYGCIEVSDKRDILNADIIGQQGKKGDWHHIGMVYLDGSVAKVIQAEESPAGITSDHLYNPSNWTKRIRLMDIML